MNEKTTSPDFINIGVVTLDNKKVLMIRRAHPERGENGAVLDWAFPGGRQRYKETREECVEREVLAETGYHIKSIRQADVGFHPEFPVVVVYHLCSVVESEPVVKPSQPEEIAEVRWVDPKDVKKLITSSLNPKIAEFLAAN